MQSTRPFDKLTATSTRGGRAGLTPRKPVLSLPKEWTHGTVEPADGSRPPHCSLTADKYLTDLDG